MSLQNVLDLVDPGKYISAKTFFFCSLTVWGVQKGVDIEKIILFVNFFYLLLIMLDNTDTKVIFLTCHELLCFSPRPFCCFCSSVHEPCHLLGQWKDLNL